MMLSFVETMRGWMRGEEIPTIPVSFELVALHARRGLFETRGLLSAPPIAIEAPARGTLELGLRALVYHLEFTAADGRRLWLDAVKRPAARSPLRSMTKMNAEIHDAAGIVVASGEMRFAIRDLPGFALSWLPIVKRAHRALDARRRHVERRLLFGGQR
jgi:hypothetical protein